MQDRFNPEGLIRTKQYVETMNEVVLPALAARGKEKTLHGWESRPLFCIVYPADHPQGTVVLVHGFTENAFKYAELIYSLLQSGFSVIAYDQRGHGRSWRPEGLLDPGDTHVDHFSDYVQDLRIVCEQLLTPMPKPWFVFAHSMGGAVTSFFLEQTHDVFDRAVLCAPMIAPDRSGIPYSIAYSLCKAAQLIGHGSHRPFFMKPYHGPEDFASSCATDPVRFAWYDAVKVAHPEYQNSAPTYRWTSESLQVTRQLLAADAPESITCPVRLYTAELDHSVLPGPQQQFIARVPRGERIFVAGAKHEIYRSTEEVLYPWWHDVLTFLKEGLKTSAHE